MKWVTLLKDIKDKVGFAQSPSASSSSPSAAAAASSSSAVDNNASPARQSLSFSPDRFLARSLCSLFDSFTL